jgi:transcriptional regulator with XRE-family HTH domain
MARPLRPASRPSGEVIVQLHINSLLSESATLLPFFKSLETHHARSGLSCFLFPQLSGTDMSDDISKSKLGPALRKLRRQNSWTLAEVSKRTGFSVPTLSKVENDRISLSYDKLIRLSEGLNVDISRLFTAHIGGAETPSITGRRSVNRRGDAQRVATPNYTHYYLSTDVVHKKLTPILVEPRARSLEEFGELVTHSGEEFIYVLEGQIEVHTSLYKLFTLQSGESAYLDSSMGHAYIRKGDGPCRLLAMCSASEMQLHEYPRRNSLPAGTRQRRAPAHTRKRTGPRQQKLPSRR